LAVPILENGRTSEFFSRRHSKSETGSNYADTVKEVCEFEAAVGFLLFDMVLAFSVAAQKSRGEH